MNSLSACEKAFREGYGIEIDVRDTGDEIIVAHDGTDAGAYPFLELCYLARQYPQRTVAINIKSCGLQNRLKPLLEKFINQYFTFDMAVPDLIKNMQHDIISFTRQSEYEKEPCLYQEVSGIWLDMFESDWLTTAVLDKHLDNGKDIAIVSPELHNRNHRSIWGLLKEFLPNRIIPSQRKLYLCTDYPGDAQQFFNATN